MPNPNFFIGMETFEELLATGLNKTVYISKGITVKPAQHGIQRRDYVVIAAVTSENCCHYWQMRVGGHSQMGDSPLISTPINHPDKCVERCESLVNETGTIARDNDYSVIRGLISFPQDLVLLEGTTRTLRYDEQTNTFEQRQGEIISEEDKIAA